MSIRLVGIIALLALFATLAAPTVLADTNDSNNPPATSDGNNNNNPPTTAGQGDPNPGDQGQPGENGNSGSP